MTLQLRLPAELEQRLQAEAMRRAQPAEEVALRLLDQHLPSAGGRAAAIAMLAQWAAEDETLSDAECAENAAILQALDEDRPSYRKLFTEILKNGPP